MPRGQAASGWQRASHVHSTRESAVNTSTRAFWNIRIDELFRQLHTSPTGLSQEEAETRLRTWGPNDVTPRERPSVPGQLLGQFKSPIILILIAAVFLSFFLRDSTDALIILAIILITGFIGFYQEKNATDAVRKLLQIIQTTSTVLRENSRQEIPLATIVPGDIVLLSAGDNVPGDCRLIESRDLFINEAALTGETFPAEKDVGMVPADTPLAQRKNMLFMGTHVVSGTAKALVVHTGKDTEFGSIARRLQLRPPETEFERGLRHFGYLLMEVTLILVILIFMINVILKRPVLDSFLFSLALAVGLTPQLLPAITTINLAHGARRMARNKVIVKHLPSIENFGSMNVLCADKTGTLTEGRVTVHAAVDISGRENEKVLRYAFINAFYEAGFVNQIDEAIRKHHRFDVSGYQKVDELPYDFIRKRLSILVQQNENRLLITKGAVPNVLAVCSSVEQPDGARVPLKDLLYEVQQQYETWGRTGLRTIGVAYRELGPQQTASKNSEADMTLLGFLLLTDLPRPDAAEIIAELRRLGLTLKVITGDSSPVTAQVCRKIGFSNLAMLTGSQLHHLSHEALIYQVNRVDIFAEVEPNQKEDIIHALKKAGNVVGFVGDGINDASALHAADVGISVNSAVDVAKDAADVVLLEKDLKVLIQGVQEGRKTFANTLKYIFMATSANFGNMFSMAGASLFLPFLPLLPKQILLTNFLTDFPEMTISTDSVDPEMVDHPRRWNIARIRMFMLVFGFLSSVFDYLTFGALLLLLHASTGQFRTGWFVESVVSASLIVLVIRTRRPFVRSMPSRYLLGATMIIAGLTVLIPYTPMGRLFRLEALSFPFLLMVAGIVILYVGSAEFVKRWFFRKVAL